MTSYARTRDRYSNFKSGGQWFFTKSGYNGTGWSGDAVHEVCYDSVSTPPYKTDHNLVLRKGIQRGHLNLNGSFYATSKLGDMVFNDYCLQSEVGADIIMGSGIPSSPYNHDYYVTKALSNMNPKKPTTDLPLFLFELKDLPRMLLDIGRFVSNAGSGVKTWGDALEGVYGSKVRLADIPGSFLSYRFGWAPLLSDLGNLIKLSHQIDQRVRYLKNLENRHSLRRKLFSGQTGSWTNRNGLKKTITVFSFPIYSADIHEEQYMDVWYTANAKLRHPLPTAQTDLRDLARRYALGLTYRHRFWWDAIPFSWMLDYLYNIGDAIEARQALVELEITRVNIMHTVRYFRSFKNEWVRPGISHTPYLGTYVAKNRIPVSVLNPRLAYRPIWNTAMYATIGALALNTVLKGRVSSAWYR